MSETIVYATKPQPGGEQPGISLKPVVAESPARYDVPLQNAITQQGPLPGAETTRFLSALLNQVRLESDLTRLGDDDLAVSRSWQGHTVFLVVKRPPENTSLRAEIMATLEQIALESVDQVPPEAPFSLLRLPTSVVHTGAGVVSLFLKLTGEVSAAAGSADPTNASLHSPTPLRAAATAAVSNGSLSMAVRAKAMAEMSPLARLKAVAAAEVGNVTKNTIPLRWVRAEMRLAVGGGQTLNGLAALLGLPASELQSYNQLPANSDPNMAIEGVIRIPGTRAAAKDAQEVARQYSRPEVGIVLLNPNHQATDPWFVPLPSKSLMGSILWSGDVGWRTGLAEVKTDGHVPASPAREADFLRRYGDHTWPTLEAMPPDLRDYYLGLVQKAETTFHVPAEDILGVHLAEQMGAGFRPLEQRVSVARAVGPGQVTPGYWNGWNGGPRNYFLTDPNQIQRYGGMGMDWDGDGVANPESLADNIAATARGLAASGLTLAMRGTAEHQRVYAEALSSYNSGKPLSQAPAVTRTYVAIGLKWVESPTLGKQLAAIHPQPAASAPAAEDAGPQSQQGVAATDVRMPKAAATGAVAAALDVPAPSAAPNQPLQAGGSSGAVKAESAGAKPVAPGNRAEPAEAVAVDMTTRKIDQSATGSATISNATAGDIPDLHRFGAADIGPWLSGGPLVDAYIQLVDQKLGRLVRPEAAQATVAAQPDVVAEYRKGAESAGAAAQRLVDKELSAYRAQANNSGRGNPPSWPYFVNLEHEQVQQAAVQRLGHTLTWNDLERLLNDPGLNPNGQINLQHIDNYLANSPEGQIFAFAQGLYRETVDGKAGHAYTPNSVLAQEVATALAAEQGQATDAARQRIALRLRAGTVYQAVYPISRFPALAAPFHTPDGRGAPFTMRIVNGKNGGSHYQMHGNINYYGLGRQSWYGVDYRSDLGNKVTAMIGGVVTAVIEGSPADGPGDSVLIQGTGPYTGLSVRMLHLAVDPTLSLSYKRSLATNTELIVRPGTVLGVQGVSPEYAHTHVIVQNSQSQDVPAPLLLFGSQAPTGTYSAAGYVDLSVPPDSTYAWLGEETDSMKKWLLP